MTKTNPIPTEDFSLNDIVADVCATRREADPAMLVDFVLAQIDPFDYEEALRQAVHGYITSYVVRQRNSVHPDDEGENTANGRKIGKSKAAGLGAFLVDREFSPARGQWILRVEVTEEDARSMAEKRLATAARFTELATWYESMADALRSNGATTVGDLPIMVQEALRSSRPR